MYRKNALCFIFCFALMASVSGCISSDYLIDRSYVIYPQDVSLGTVEGVRDKSMNALLKAFTDYKWEFHSIDKENYSLVAEVCRRGEHCVEVKADVRDDGSVEITRTPGQDLTRNEGELLRRWLANVKKAYNKHISLSL